ncbi:MFS transporter [Georgenia sp. H159]|uniref:MFS transporter n=1 Tax=Georgenia sp. H159 TaxID=3076115 RepID=UPI002D78B740|nr:MFS transporter [Georgenia sp. H159]
MSRASARARPFAAPFSLLLASFVSAFDRLALTPILIDISEDLGEPLPAVLGVATLYLFAYALMQWGWGVLFGRLGRARTLRLSLLIAAACGIVTAASTNLALLAISRTLSGAALAAVIPAALVYIGDTVPARNRQGPLADIMIATAVGMAAGTLVPGLLAEYATWRLSFVLVFAVAILSIVAIRSIVDPPLSDDAVVGSWRALRYIFAIPQARLVLLFVFVEGVVVIGVLSVLPTVLQLNGVTAAVAGLTTAAYGVAVLLFAPILKRAANVLQLPTMLGLGGVFGVLAYVAMSIDQSTSGVLIGAVFLAGTWAFMHTSMQNWATRVAPGARPLMISVFAGLLFLGSSIGTAIGMMFAGTGDFSIYFVGGLLTMTGVGVGAYAAIRSYFAGGAPLNVRWRPPPRASTARPCCASRTT